MLDDATFFTPVRALGAQLRARKLTSQALTEGCLDRLERLGPRYNAVVTLMRDSALEEARRADREIAAGRARGTLHGVPYGVKDLVATKGVPTTWGAAPYREQVFDHDATVVERLRAAGAVLVAKLAMVELAGGMGYNHADASFTGPGLTPWNTRFWSGGSSSGPGAAVAAGLVPFAIGSETSGSILTPSAYSGVTGLRPTYGRVSRHGAMALCWTLDKLGPMARTARDCALILAAIQGIDPADPSSVPSPPAQPIKRRRPFRIGVLKDSAKFVHEEVARNFEESVRVLGSFSEVTPDVSLPDFPYGLCTGPIVEAEGASAFLDLIESGGLQKLRAKADHVGGYSNILLPAVDYLQALRLREKMRAPVAALYEKFDLLATPSRATVAFPIGVDFDKAFPALATGRPQNFVSPIGSAISMGNLLGHPALSLPNGFGREGLPTGLQLLAPAFGEDTLSAVGEEYQRRPDFHAKTPPGY